MIGKKDQENSEASLGKEKRKSWKVRKF
jgi:hypothetical protein